MTIADKLLKVNEGVDKVIELNNELEQTLYGTDTGGKSHYDEFWDLYQRNGARTNYTYAFYNVYWDDTIYNPKYTIAGQKFRDCFKNSGVIDTKVPIDISGATTASDVSGLFGDSKLVTIRQLIVKETTPFYTNTFQNCKYLENLTISGTIGQNGFDVSTSSLLTHDSLMSIINALQDKTSDTNGTSWVCTLGTDNLAKLTDAEKAIATNKGWSLA